MKFMSFSTRDVRASYGVMRHDGVVDLGGRLAAQGAPTLRTLLARGMLDAARRIAEETRSDLKAEDVVFAPVIPDPEKIICVGLNYHDHVAETGRTATEFPVLFARYPASQTGHLQPLVRPKVSNSFDFEGELAVIIGLAGRHITAQRALEHVAGYSCYNEGSIRDWQRHTSQFFAGKTFDQSGSFGPWMVTTDEIPDPSRLTLETRLNGQVVQHTTTDLMITGIPRLIEYISTILPLVPGDVIVTGTPGGVGAKRTPPLWMKPGDVVEVEVSGIGVLRNGVVVEAA